MDRSLDSPRSRSHTAFSSGVADRQGRAIPVTAAVSPHRLRSGLRRLPSENDSRLKTNSRRSAAMRKYFASPSLYIGLLSLALPVAVAAQFTTSLRGTVTDPSGSAIPDAVLTLTNAGTGFKRQVLTSADGVYQFLQAPPGT